MIPNYAETGKPVPPSLFNRLVDAVRASQILTMVGGRVFRGAGGVSLTVDQGTAAGGGGGAPAMPCPFKVTDATDGENLMVEVAYGEIANRVPFGMVLGKPYLLDVSATGRVYASIEFDPAKLDVISGEMAVTIFYQPGAPLPNTSTVQYSLLATVIVTDGAISSITNGCYTPTASPCSLAYA